MGDAARFEHLFRQHYSEVVRFCQRRLSHHAADDVVAEVFATTWRRLDDIDDQRARAWLFAVARNEIQHRWRADGRRSAAEGRARRARRPVDGADPAERVSEAEAIALAADRLSPADRELLELVSWEALGPADLAVVLGCSTNAATVRVHRMRERFQQHLDALQEPAPTGNHRRKEER